MWPGQLKYAKKKISKTRCGKERILCNCDDSRI
jgi:hypothetical protein